MKNRTTVSARTLEALLEEMSGGLVPSWLFFWGHTPPKDGSVGKACFSQWWCGHPFEEDENHYQTAEHYMMAGKARLFGDSEALHAILTAENPAVAKKLGRTVRGFSDEKCLAARWSIVVRGNYLKFSQHPDLAGFLTQTGQRILVEASPYDRIWGIGLGKASSDIENPAKWKGLNLLGFALMEVRAQLERTAFHE